ncbi:MAG: type II secretion system F family protein [Roseburia sp.]|nr:type II secretion system F family protein [Roseburia sp.]
MQECVDYGKYTLSLREEWGCFGITVLLSVTAAWILYRSCWGLLLGIAIFPLCRKSYRRSQVEKRKQELLIQFRDGMQSVSVALLSGYSIENAWREAEKELGELYGEQAYMTEEMRKMNSGIRMNLPVEQLLYQFAQRSACEDILDFSEIFRFAKRSGGNFGKIIRNTIMRISEKMEVEQEIRTALAGKKMEQKVMNVVPVCLLAYLNTTSAEFLAPLYGNLFGVCVMTIAFVAYVGALILAQRMVDIKV